MQIPKEQILQFVQERLGGDKADQVSRKLNDTVDTDKHADVLAQHGINIQDLVGKFGGGLGNLI